MVRHGETDWNKQKRYQGQTDIDLNDHGFSQESSLLKVLSKKDFNIILSSPLKRTMSTAIKLSKLKDIECIKYDFLKERKLGQFESQNLQQIREKWPNEAETFETKDINFAPPGGESLTQFYKRVTDGFEKILRKHKNQSIIIFTHGGVINCLYHYICQSDMNQIGKWKISIPNASYTTIKIEEKIEILEQSVTKHLSDESLDELK
jgi:probable phosphoglycerate mutase